MKTLTEFSTLMLRKAAAARATVASDPLSGQATVPASTAPAETSGDERATPGDAVESAEPQAGAPEPAEAAATEPGDSAPAHETSAADSAVEAAADDVAADEAATGEAAPDGESTGTASEPAAPSFPAAMVDAVVSACGVQPDRALRLLEALAIVDRDIDRVRLVRVYQGEKGPHNAVSRGEFHYVVDRVAGPARNRREPKAGRGGDRPERGGGGGGGAGGSFSGGDRKPRGLGSLKFGAATETKDPRDDRPGRGEMPRAGIGWQLTSTPRSFGEGGRGEGRGRGPGRGPRGRGPRSGGPGGGGPGGRGPGRGFRDSRGPTVVTDASGRSDRPQFRTGRAADHGEAGAEVGGHQAPRQPRLGPDGQPLPPRSKRPRKAFGPDEKGLGPDGTPWDPERRAKRLEEQKAKMNTTADPAVEVPPSPPPAPAPVEKTD